MSAFAYYNEIDERAVAWLNELIKRGVIADGVVDARPLQEVDPDDLRGFTQCHFLELRAAPRGVARRSPCVDRLLSLSTLQCERQETWIHR